MVPIMLICEREAKKCISCGRSIFGEKSFAELCDNCAKKFRDHCPICGKHLTRGVAAPLCRDCARKLKGSCWICNK